MKDTNKRVMWAGDVEGGEFGFAWRDVQAARGKTADAPATRSVRIQLGDDGITLCCFSPDIMLYADVTATGVTANENVQVAILDEHKTFADLLSGMRKEAGEAHLELHGEDAGASDTLWQPKHLVVRWAGNEVAVPIAEMAPARFESIEALLSLNTPTLGPQNLSHTSNVLKRLGQIGKHVSFTFYGDDMPIAVRTTDDIRGSILAHLIILRSPERGDTVTAVEVEAVRFLDGMRKPVSAQAATDDEDTQKERLDDEWPGEDEQE